MSGHHRRLSGPQWDAARLRVLEGAGWRCERCQAAGALEAHHKTPLHRGGAPYDPENLLVLCRACHVAAHRRPLTAAEQAWRDVVDAIRD